ncbi:hypothetical protein [Roseburia sp. 499]|uniref:hypothetical protein n=1 Tax=Roseburia sp. 499 TaxID=1261634 RepID=UPI000952E17F|nr:hypothetical protein [Roseburia sp. 499]WVK68546.1 hypothetical protein BIV20_09085 [Roseburia sp. 499]
MKKHIKFLITGVAVMLACATLTGCTSEEEREAAAKYKAEAEKYVEGNNYEAAQKSMKKALEQTPKDEELLKASEELDKKAEEMNAYTKTLEAAIAAIEADDAQALNELQESDAGKALAEMIGDEGSYIYIAEGGTTGKGIGVYALKGDERVWYYGDYATGIRDGNGICYYVSPNMEGEGLYKEVYTGEWREDKPNGTGRQLVVRGDIVYKDQDYTVKDGLFYGTYQINDTLEDGTPVTGSYTLVDGKYQTISDEELLANSFAVPTEPHLSIAFLFDASGVIKSCRMIKNVVDTTEGVVGFR